MTSAKTVQTFISLVLITYNPSHGIILKNKNKTRAVELSDEIKFFMEDKWWERGKLVMSQRSYFEEMILGGSATAAYKLWTEYKSDKRTARGILTIRNKTKWTAVKFFYHQQAKISKSQYPTFVLHIKDQTSSSLDENLSSPNTQILMKSESVAQVP